MEGQCHLFDVDSGSNLDNQCFNNYIGAGTETSLVQGLTYDRTMTGSFGLLYKWKKMIIYMLVANSVLVKFILSNFNIVISWIASMYHAIVLQSTFGEQATLFVDRNEALFKLAIALSPKHLFQSDL